MAAVQVRSGADHPLAGAFRAARWWDDATLSDGIEAAARATSDARAVADGDTDLTYGELAARVHATVAALDRTGAGDGAPVVLVAGNTVGAVVAYHAILRAGATVAVLDRRAGAADLRAARAALGDPSLVIVPAAEHDRLARDAGTPAVALEEITASAGSVDADRPEPDRDAPRVVLLTSGTTGRPKGVVHSINTLTAGARNFARIAGADAHTVLFLVSPVTSIAGVTQMHLFADLHGTLVLEDRFDPVASLDQATAYGATLLGGAPVIAERLLGAAEAREDTTFPIRTLALGGAMLARPLLERATDRFGVEIARVYGSSEMPCATGSVPSDTHEVRLADDGRLMPGTEVRVGSSAAPQEGLLRGPAGFLGYADPDDDAAAFEDGWFRTGDLVEVHTGRLTVIGRLKEVVDRNGLKISLGEVDAALAGPPGAVEHAGFARPDPDTGERLAVAVRPAPGAAITLADVVAHLERHGTARRKLPEEVVTWDGPLPRTPSGKVVRARLVMDAPGRPTEVAGRIAR
jgi:acyl-CoA synthetase (AMP-forming)/AMP-acid ligase II